MTAVAIDANNMEGFSLRRRRLAGEKSSVRRNLFGPVDHERVNSILRAELDKIDEEKISKWNFDFKTDSPLDGEYKWEPADGYVPKFYEAKVVVSTIANRSTRYTDPQCSTATSRRSDCSTRNVNPLNCVECRGQSTRPKRADEFSPISTTPSTPVQPKLNSPVSTPKTPSTPQCSNNNRATTRPAKRQPDIREMLKQRKRQRRLNMDASSTKLSKVSGASADIQSSETLV